MKIAFYGGETVGVITLLALLAQNHYIACVIPEDERVAEVAKIFDIPLKPKKFLESMKFIRRLKKEIDIFICCHGRKILPKSLFESVKCINIHPCLYKYKGVKPVKRLIEDKNPRASVAVHFMTEKIDKGKTIVELFTRIDGVGQMSEIQVYTKLYPLYVKALVKALDKIA